MSKPRGFTLIELLVVIAIIAMLLSILMPALNIAKRKAQGVVCLANLNGLSKGWYIYSIDNDGRIVVGSGTRTPARLALPTAMRKFTSGMVQERSRWPKSRRSLTRLNQRRILQTFCSCKKDMPTGSSMNSSS